MKNGFVCFLVLTVALQASAGEIWVTLPNLTTRSEQTRSVTLHRAQINQSDFISVYDALLRRPISSATLSHILGLEEQGQSATLNGQFGRALRIYSELRGTLESIPNVAGIERIVFSTFVHIAESHDLLNDRGSEEAWRQAHAWFNASKEGSKEFSPKTLSRLKAIRMIAAAQVEIHCPMESAVYVDGRSVGQIEGHFVISLEPGYHQVSVLTPGAEWMIKPIHLVGHEMRELEFHPEPLVEGTCEDPHYAGGVLPAKTKLLVSFGQCDRVYFDRTWFTVNGLRLESLAPKPNANSMMTEMASTPEEKNWWSSLSQSKWFWIGLGAVAIGATAAVVQNQNQVNYTPTNSVR